MSIPLETLVWAAPVVLFAYTVFGLAGFGSAVIATPLLAQGIPLHTAVPMMLLLDFCASLLMGGRNRRHVDRGELLRLLPYMLIGIVLGVTALVHAPERWLLLLLGVFVFCYAGRKLLRPADSPRQISTLWALPIGTAGGIFTALFGVGGPIYTLYVAGRVRDPLVLRATMAAVVTMGGFVRIPMFWYAGFYSSGQALELAGWLMPFAIGGIYLGSHVHSRVPTARVIQMVWGLLVFSGAGLVWRNV